MKHSFPTRRSSYRARRTRSTGGDSADPRRTRGTDGAIVADTDSISARGAGHGKSSNDSVQSSSGVELDFIAARIASAVKPWLARRSEEHTSELQSLMRISYAVFCLKKKRQTHNNS